MTMTKQITADDVLTDGRLSRNYDADEFRAVIEDRDDYSRAVGQHVVRLALRRLDSGRFADVLESTHKFLAHMDHDGLDSALAMMDDELLAWVNVYAVSEDLREIRPLAADGGYSGEIKPNYGALGSNR